MHVSSSDGNFLDGEQAAFGFCGVDEEVTIHWYSRARVGDRGAAGMGDGGQSASIFAYSRCSVAVRVYVARPEGGWGIIVSQGGGWTMAQACIRVLLIDSINDIQVYFSKMSCVHVCIRVR